MVTLPPSQVLSKLDQVLESTLHGQEKPSTVDTSQVLVSKKHVVRYFIIPNSKPWHIYLSLELQYMCVKQTETCAFI